jgi:hypothetical protein
VMGGSSAPALERHLQQGGEEGSPASSCERC